MQQQRERIGTAQIALWSMPLLAVAHIAYYWSLLPERMASHFGPSGKADGWMSKISFALFHLGMTLVMTILFSGIGGLLRKTPNEMINLPNKEYWLAPERRDATLRALSQQMSLFGIAVVAFLFAVNQSVILTNINGKDTLGGLFGVYFAAFMLYTAIWTVGLVKRFRLPS